MRIPFFRFHIIGGAEDVILVNRKLSRLDKERIGNYLSGQYHFVRKSKGRKPKHPPLTSEEIGAMITDMGKEEDANQNPKPD